MIAVALTVALALQKPGPPPSSADTAGGGASRPCEVAIDSMARPAGLTEVWDRTLISFPFERSQAATNPGNNPMPAPARISSRTKRKSSLTRSLPARVAASRR